MPASARRGLTSRCAIPKRRESLKGLAWTIGATFATLLVAAMLPIARATRQRLATELVGASSSASLASRRVRQSLLALQVCASIIVLVSAGLFVRAVVHGFGAAPGFDVDRTVFVTVQETSPWANAAVTGNFKALLPRAPLV